MGQIAKDCNLDVERGEIARALHRVVRAMHDGHCPKCGHLAPSDRFYCDFLTEEGTWKSAHTCPSCGFTISEDEAKKALVEFRPSLNKSVEVFETWKAQLITPKSKEK